MYLLLLLYAENSSPHSEIDTSMTLQLTFLIFLLCVCVHVCVCTHANENSYVNTHVEGQRTAWDAITQVIFIFVSLIGWLVLATVSLTELTTFALLAGH